VKASNNKLLAEKNLINTEKISNVNCFYSYSQNMNFMQASNFK